MSTPWPDDVFDCAKRLARSLGYQETDISEHKGRVYVFCAEKSDGFTEKISELYNTPVTPLWAIFDGNWRELDPRDPTVWSALIGPHGVGSLFCWKSNYVCPGRYADRTSYHPGLAVCEVYNDLKGHPLEKYIDIPRVAFVTKKSGRSGK